MESRFQRRIATFAALALVSVAQVGASPAGASAPKVIQVRSTSAVFLSDTAGTYDTVQTVAVSAGWWTVTSHKTIVDFYSADFIRCHLEANATAIDGGATTYLEGTVGGLVNVGTFKARSALNVVLRCTHDAPATTPGQFYVDAGATLTAIKGGPIDGPSSPTPPAGATVVQRRTDVRVALTVQQPTVVLEVPLTAGTWSVMANASLVDFLDRGWPVCLFAGSGISIPVPLPATTAFVGDVDSYVSDVTLIAKVTVATTGFVELYCHPFSAAHVSVDPGATVTATRAAGAASVKSGSIGPATLDDGAGTQTQVFSKNMPPGPWTANSSVSAFLQNPNGGVGGATDFVRCNLRADGVAIDGGATVLINKLDSLQDGGNYEQVIANSASYTAPAKWVLSLTCAHDAAVATGHWKLEDGGGIVAMKNGPISTS